MGLFRYSLLFSLLLIPYAFGQSFLTSSNVFTGWFGTIVLGAAAASVLVGIYYMIGYLLNNSRVKAGAISEFSNVIGIAIIIALLIAVFYYFGGALLFTNTVSQTQMVNICNQLTNSNINLLSSAPKYNSPANTVCNNIITPSTSTGSVTRNLDYGLGAVYVIEDNLTNQSADSLNSVFLLSTMLGFLNKYTIRDAVCFPIECLIPDVPSVFELSVNATPFAGYPVGGTVPAAVALEAQLMFYFLILQLILIILMLLLWPYLLAAGMIFESFFFTRRLGGFLIAMVVSSMLVYPTIFLFEYSSLNNVQNLQPVGASAIPNLALCGAPASGLQYNLLNEPAIPQLTGNSANGIYCYTDASSLPLSYIYKVTLPEEYTDIVPSAYDNYPPDTMVPACPTMTNGMCFIKRDLNFFVFPNIKDIMALYFTWPQGGSLLSFETVFIVPGVNIVTGVANAIAALTSLLSSNYIGSVPAALYAYVDPAHVIGMLLALINVYAIDAVVGFILPIFNILILISSILEISKLLGGEASILGLSRFV